MFTGIVECTGTVTKLATRENLVILSVRPSGPFKNVRAGDSVCVDGVCLTVTSIKKNVLNFDIMRETLIKTTLGMLKPKMKVNLERALKADGRFDGHFVTGHIDNIGVVKNRVTKKNYIELRVQVPAAVMRYIVPKGSVCVDGISLTVGEVGKTHFSVYLIPYTEKNTTVGSKTAGDKVNVETDILAKYVLNNG